jgi:hypothetical protein
MMLDCSQAGVFAGSAQVMGKGLCKMPLDAKCCVQSGQRPTTKGGQNTRYPIPEPELPEPRPEVPEPEIPDHNFG